jgi:DNA-binding protein HU-beta
MNKSETIQTVARSAELSRDVAERLIEAFEACLKMHTDAGARVVLRGFGSFSRGLPSPKVGRNPRTGQSMTYLVYHKPKHLPSVSEFTLCREMAARVSIGEATAHRVLDALQAAIAATLRQGGVVSLKGFGRFDVGRRAARSGRNPRTGDVVLIPAANVLRFKASKTANAGAKFSAGSALKAALL